METRKRAEESLGESEERFRSLAENAREIIAEYDSEEGLRYVSPSVTTVLGYSRGELMNSDLFSRFHPDDLDKIAPAMREAFEKRAPVELTARFKRKDGAWRQIEASTQSFETASGKLRVVGVARDVTVRREIEKRLRESQKLEAVARLASGIAHDFNNLLTVISGHVEFLEAQGGGDDKGRASLHEVSDATTRGAALVRQLFDFSRDQAFDPQVVEVNEAVRDMEPLLRRMLGEQVELVTRVAERPLPTLIDASKLEQIIVNLVLNARDAIPSTGRVVIETRPQRPPGSGAAGDAGRLALVVTDDGVGMDEFTRQRIFEPFFSTKEPGRGTGLGLSTVHGIVEQSGGTIEVESAEGAGSSFRVVLPCVPESQPERPRSSAADRSDPAGGTETVLLVEDEAPVRGIVRQTLEERGYRVLEACNGGEALELAHSTGDRIDLLLTDVVMPVVGGADLAGMLGRERPGLRTLFMSGYAERPPGSPPIDAAQLIEKPFGLQELAQRVRAALDA